MELAIVLPRWKHWGRSGESPRVAAQEKWPWPVQPGAVPYRWQIRHIVVRAASCSVWRAPKDTG